jgi:dephospho-CoA kinase
MEIDSPEPLLILLHGGPATGKTTLGLRLAETFGVPYISKDGVKEPIFDHHAPRFRSLQEKYSVRLVQILCRTEAEELRRRLEGRAESGERHAGHQDRDLAQRLDPAAIDRDFRFLEIGGLQITVDTTTPTSAEEYDGVVGRIRTF